MTISSLMNSVRKGERLEWTKQHMIWILEQLQVVWSGEKKLNLHDPGGYSYYWHDMQKEKYSQHEETCLESFGQHEKSDTVFIEGTMNATQYRDIQCATKGYGNL